MSIYDDDDDNDDGDVLEFELMADGTPTVRDSSGQRWWPNEVGRFMLHKPPFPLEEAAIVLSKQGPGFGEWKS